MAEEQLDLQAPETGLTETAEAAPPEKTADGPAPTEETGSAEGSEQENQPAKAPDVPKGWKWNGDVNALEDGMKERGRGMLRHFTEESEKLADQRRQLENQFALLKEAQSKPEPPQAPVEPTADPNEEYLRREYQDAIDNGDSQKLFGIQTKLTDYRLQKQLQAIEPQYRKIVEESQRVSAEVKNTMLLKEFGEKNPRIWTHKESKLAPFVVREICDKQGKSLAEAQKVMDEIASFYQNETKRSLNQTVQEQKKAISATPTTPMETKYVYVGSAREADKMNVQLAIDGSDKIAVVKKS